MPHTGTYRTDGMARSITINKAAIKDFYLRRFQHAGEGGRGQSRRGWSKVESAINISSKLPDSATSSSCGGVSFTSMLPSTTPATDLREFSALRYALAQAMPLSRLRRLNLLGLDLVSSASFAGGPISPRRHLIMSRNCGTHPPAVSWYCILQDRTSLRRCSGGLAV